MLTFLLGHVSGLRRATVPVWTAVSLKFDRGTIISFAPWSVHLQPNSCFVTNSMHPKLRQDGLSGTESALMLGVHTTDIQHVSISGWVYL